MEPSLLTQNPPKRRVVVLPCAEGEIRIRDQGLMSPLLYLELSMPPARVAERCDKSGNKTLNPPIKSPPVARLCRSAVSTESRLSPNQGEMARDSSIVSSVSTVIAVTLL